MKLGTADICDQYGGAVQVAQPGFHSYGGCKAVSAPIETIKIYRDNALFWDVLRQPGNGRILFVDAGADYGAVMGDKMATIAVEQGWKGMVINGYIRDTAVLRTMPLAVWALGSCPTKRAMQATGEQGLDLCFWGLNIVPGAYVYADEDGILLSEAALSDYDQDFNLEFGS